MADTPDTTQKVVKVLVVEDSPTQLAELRFLLEESGFSVVAATNGTEGLAAAKANAIDLVISDVLMPEMDGYALCKALRADETLRQLPVILLTSLADPRDVIQALEAGANNFVRKPCAAEYLLARIQNVLATVAVRKTAGTEMALTVRFRDRHYSLSQERLQLLDVLLSTYEDALYQLPNATEPSIAGARVLVVEDSPTQTERIRFVLEECGCAVVTATNGRGGLAALGENHIDLVLSDVLMPEMDGYALCKAIRAGERLRDVPIILLTALADPRDVIAGLEAGATNFIRKPFDDRYLAARVRHLLAGQKTRAESSVKPGIDIVFAGQRYTVTADRMQMLDLLLSSYDNAVQQNTELARARDELRVLNEQLEARVAERTAELEERVKEVKCLHAVSSLVAEPGRSLDESLKAAVDLIPRGWQYPEITRARIVFEGQEFASASFRDTAWKQSADIVISGAPVGTVEVCYLEERPDADDGPFLKEERNLVDDIARQLGLTIERKQAEQALRESEARYERAVNGANDGIWEWTPATGEDYLSPRWKQLLGYQDHELPNVWASVLDQLHPEDHSRVVEAIRAHLEERTPYDIELRLRCKSGEYRWFRSRGQATWDEQGQPLRMAGSITDITERKRADAQLQLQAAALGAAADAIMITDRQGTIEWVNAAFRGLTGYSTEEAIGRNPRDLVNSGLHDRSIFASLWETILAGNVWRGELTNRRKDGTRYVEEQTITTVRDEKGEIAHFIAITQDVTERKGTEDELRRQRETLHQSEKLAAMGQLLAGVAHELNNPLAVVVGHATLLCQTTDGAIASRAQKIGAAAARCARIVKNFLALARQHEPERQTVALNQVVRDAVELLAYQLRVDGVEVAATLGADLPLISADPHQLQQVVVNLVTNAHHAMRQAARPRRLSLTTYRVAGADRVCLAVEDTGPGIAPDVEAHLFEPFFTTKPVGEGTGLGLSICKGIVESHGGTITGEGRPGRGARFAVELPIGGSAPPAVAVEPEGPAPRGLAILVVDDERQVAEVIAEMLAGEGCRVAIAGNGLEALDVLAREMFDVVISDLKMPVMDGIELYRGITQRHPALRRRMVFVTGDTLTPSTAEFLREIGARSVRKPFTVAELRSAVHAVREGGSPAEPPLGEATRPGQ